MRIIVCGTVVAAAGQGGVAWAMLSWVLGARALGHETVLVEPLPAPPTPAQRAYARAVQRATGVRPLLLAPGDALPPADVLLNLSGLLPAERAAAIPVRVFVDLDPGFTQAWALSGIDVGLAGHTAHATVGLAVGRPGCRVPDLGLTWLTLPPPVALEAWPVAERIETAAATTVGHWRSYGTAHLDGVTLGQRAHTVRGLLDLPARAPLPVRPALAIDSGDAADQRLLAAAGWQLSDPSRAAGSPARYRRFVQASRLELGFAKSGYVTCRSGWFSDRTAAYLASGRPAVVSDTGTGDLVDFGEGLLTYCDVDEAVAALESVLRDEQRHARAARRFAEQHLDARIVVSGLLERTC